MICLILGSSASCLHEASCGWAVSRPFCSLSSPLQTPSTPPKRPCPPSVLVDFTWSVSIAPSICSLWSGTSNLTHFYLTSHLAGVLRTFWILFSVHFPPLHSTLDPTPEHTAHDLQPPWDFFTLNVLALCLSLTTCDRLGCIMPLILQCLDTLLEMLFPKLWDLQEGGRG